MREFHRSKRKLLMAFMMAAMVIATLQGHAQTSDTLVVRALESKGIRFSHNNSVTLLMSGQEKFDDLFKAIDQARSSIHMEYFNFRNDSINRELISHLAPKVKEGVEVRLLYDAFGNMSNNSPMRKKDIAAIRALGIEIYQFDPIRFPFVNHVWSRDHRKIVVIDGCVAYTGGMNVADYYIKGTDQVGEWHDMHCRIEGDAVNGLQRIFLRIWNKTAKQNIHGPQYYRGLGNISYFNGLKTDSCQSREHQQVGIINREPHTSNTIIRDFYLSAINSAKDSIKIINPYFTLIGPLKRAIKKAVKRGVKVDIMLSVKCDEPITPDCGFYNAHKLMKKGCHIWMFEPGFHHTKIIMVDGRLCTVGSANLDSRSLRFDYEENAVIIDKCVTAQLEHLFNSQKSDSFKLTEKKWKEWRTPWQRFRAWFAHLLSPWL
ncbi:MAG: cardiolipin synthase [Prevotella sp.]|nr:cardiolipin synthase [Prevotella sp.]